jgi:hypothetical protein
VVNVTINIPDAIKTELEKYGWRISKDDPEIMSKMFKCNGFPKEVRAIVLQVADELGIHLILQAISFSLFDNRLSGHLWLFSNGLTVQEKTEFGCQIFAEDVDLTCSRFSW